MLNVWRLMAALCCVGSMLMAGCGSGSSATTAAKPKKIIIGIIGKSIKNRVFQAADAGAVDAAKELSDKLKMDIEVNIQTPPDESSDRQKEAIEALVRLGAKGLAISCSNAGIKDTIDQAVDGGVPVVCFDSDSPDSKRLCYYGTDDIACGTQVMKFLAKEMGEKGTVAILAGSPLAPNLRRRVEGVRAELKKYPDMKEISSGAVNHVEDAGIAAETLQQMQRVHPEIGGWALVGGWPLFTSDALPWPAGKVKVVSVDALPEEIGYLNSGHVQVLLAQDCYGWGHKSVEILVDKIVNGKDPEKVIIDPLTLVTKENSAEWSKKWDKWLKH